MKEDELLRGIDGIREDLLQDAAVHRKKRNNTTIHKYVTLAAAAAAAVLLLIAGIRIFTKEKAQGPEAAHEGKEVQSDDGTQEEKDTEVSGSSAPYLDGSEDVNFSEGILKSAEEFLSVLKDPESRNRSGFVTRYPGTKEVYENLYYYTHETGEAKFAVSLIDPYDPSVQNGYLLLLGSYNIAYDGYNINALYDVSSNTVGLAIGNSSTSVSFLKDTYLLLETPDETGAGENVDIYKPTNEGYVPYEQYYYSFAEEPQNAENEFKGSRFVIYWSGMNGVLESHGGKADPSYLKQFHWAVEE